MLYHPCIASGLCKTEFPFTTTTSFGQGGVSGWPVLPHVSTPSVGFLSPSFSLFFPSCVTYPSVWRWDHPDRRFRPSLTSEAYVRSSFRAIVSSFAYAGGVPDLKSWLRSWPMPVTLRHQEATRGGDIAIISRGHVSCPSASWGKPYDAAGGTARAARPLHVSLPVPGNADGICGNPAE